VARRRGGDGGGEGDGHEAQALPLQVLHGGARVLLHQLGDLLLRHCQAVAPRRRAAAPPLHMRGWSQRWWSSREGSRVISRCGTRGTVASAVKSDNIPLILSGAGEERKREREMLHVTSEDMSATSGATAAAPPSRLMLSTCVGRY
jgi:hypothetical protein